MDDLISRQAAIDEIGKIQTYKLFEGDDMVLVDKDEAQKELRLLPSAQKKGKWIHDGYDFPHGNDWIHCSECGKRGINVPADLTNFCSNCGARMEADNATDRC